MADVGAVWHLRYRSASASAYKWELVGGSLVSAEVTTQQGTASITYVALATAGPLITVPLAGDYDVEIAFYGTAGASNAAYMSYDIGATGATDSDAAYCVDTLGGGYATGIKKRRKTALAASTTLTSKYRSTSGAATAVFRERRMFVKPIRVG
jgi:hypothetical protein